MTVTNTLATKKALTASGLTKAQAETMANLDEQHAADAAEHISRVFAADFAKLETKIESTVRDQTWRVIVFVAATAGITIAIIAILTR